MRFFSLIFSMTDSLGLPSSAQGEKPSKTVLWVGLLGSTTAVRRPLGASTLTLAAGREEESATLDSTTIGERTTGTSSRASSSFFASASAARRFFSLILSRMDSVGLSSGSVATGGFGEGGAAGAAGAAGGGLGLGLGLTARTAAVFFKASAAMRFFSLIFSMKDSLGLPSSARGEKPSKTELWVGFLGSTMAVRAVPSLKAAASIFFW